MYNYNNKSSIDDKAITLTAPFTSNRKHQSWDTRLIVIDYDKWSSKSETNNTFALEIIFCNQSISKFFIEMGIHHILHLKIMFTVKQLIL